MTRQQQRAWLNSGQVVAIGTLAVLMGGACVSLFAQLADAQQAAVNATLTAQIAALSDRLGKVEAQINYVLAGVVGSLLTNLMQFRASRGGK